jgi:hypothetical protein
MKTLPAHTLEGVFDLRISSVLEKAIDAIELTDDELERTTGSCFGWGGWGGWGGCGCFIPVIPICCDFCGFGGWGGWGW